MVVSNIRLFGITKTLHTPSTNIGLFSFASTQILPTMLFTNKPQATWIGIHNLLFLKTSKLSGVFIVSTL